MQHLRYFVSISLILIIAFIVSFLEWKFSYSSHSLVRTDTVEVPTLSKVCLDSAIGNVTADYSVGRYVTFPDRSSASFNIQSSEYPGDAICSVNTELIFTTDPPSNLQVGDTIKLWTSDPNANHDTTPPTITNLTAGSITQTGATITWTTAGEPASTTHTIKYGTTSGSYDSYPNTKSAGSGTSASGAL